MKFATTALVALSSIFGLAKAGFSAQGNDNVVLYWGQNSAGALGQKSLGEYCESTDADMYIVSFLYQFPNTALNIVGCWTTFEGSSLLHCPDIGKDIKKCQSLGKKVLLSLGGAAGSYGFQNDQEGADYAVELWNMFGGGQHETRPFDDAIVDGFDLDIENGNDKGYAAMVTKLRELFNGGEYYIGAAPQCVFPDASVGHALANSYIDFCFIQFYNNPCGVDKGSGFNWDTWKDYATNISPNKNIKLYLGIPASSSAAGSGYSSPEQISSILQNIKSDSSFGGIMMWDASQAFNNIIGGQTYCHIMKSLVSGGSSGGQSPASSYSAPVTTSQQQQPTTYVSYAPIQSSVQWGQQSEVSSPFPAASETVVVSSAPGQWEQPQQSPASSWAPAQESVAYSAPGQWEPPQQSSAEETQTPNADGAVVVTEFATQIASAVGDQAAAVNEPLDNSASPSPATTEAPVNNDDSAQTEYGTQFEYTTIYVRPGGSPLGADPIAKFADNNNAASASEQYDEAAVIPDSTSVNQSSSSVESTTLVYSTHFSDSTTVDNTVTSTVTSSTSSFYTSSYSTVFTQSSAAPVIGSGAGSVIDPSKVKGDCQGKVGKSLSSCLNSKFIQNEGVELPSENSPADVKADGDNVIVESGANHASTVVVSVDGSASATIVVGSAVSSAPAVQPTFDPNSCTEGAVTCKDRKFALCNFNKWVLFACPPTTVCSAKDLDGVNVVVGCNFESVVLAELEAAKQQGLAEKRGLDQGINIGRGIHGHHVHRPRKP